MKEDWKECKLGDVILFKNGKKRLSSIGNIPVYGGNGILGYSNESNHANCIIVGRVGAYCGNVFYEKNNCWISDNAIVGLPNINNDIRFCYYLISQLQLNKRCIGTGQPLLTQEILNRIDILLPPLATQQKIAQILSSLDDKIELNNKINNNLEQQAQAIFKSWFVEFEPFGGKMPEGWRMGKLSEIADYLNGLAMQKFRPLEDEEGLPVLKIKELRQGTCDESSELCSPSLVRKEYIIHDGDVIFSWSGTLFVDLWCGGNCGLNQHLFKVTSKNYDKWFYYLWTKHHLDKFIFLAADKATTMGHIKREELDKAEVVIPDFLVYNKLNNILQPMIEQIITTRVENRKLSYLRDILLPKLMNGEIEV